MGGLHSNFVLKRNSRHEIRCDLVYVARIGRVVGNFRFLGQNETILFSFRQFYETTYAKDGGGP